LSSTCRTTTRTSSSYHYSVISVEFVVYLPYNDTYVDDVMWLGAAVEIGGSKIWAAEMSVTVVNTSFSDMVGRLV